MNKVTEFLEKIKLTAKKMPEPRVLKSMEIGQTARQGDIYLTRIKSIEKIKTLKIKSSRQIANGSSKGARHIVSDDCIIYENPNQNIFIGDFIDANKEGFTLTHPEHAWICGFPKGFYQIGFQLDFNRQQRAKD